MSEHSPLTNHHSPIWNRVPELARASLMILTIVLLTGLCTLLACHDSGRRASRADLDLLDDTSSLNLNITSVDASAVNAAPAVSTDSDRLTAVTSCYQREPALAGAPESSPILELESLALPPAVATWESFAIPTRHHGDSPMMRNWKLLGLDMILVGALAAPVAAGQIDGPTSDVKQDDTVVKEVRQLK